jgi:hypothetical protein
VGWISTVMLVGGLVLSGIGLAMLRRRDRAEQPTPLSPTTGSALDTTLYHLIKDISREPMPMMGTRAPRGTPVPTLRPSTLPADTVHASRFAAVAPPSAPSAPPPRARLIEDDFSEDAPTLVAGAYVVSVSPALPLEVHQRTPRRRRTR